MFNQYAAEEVLARMRDEKIIAVIRESDPSIVRDLVVTLVEAGIGIIEMTMTTPDAVGLIASCGTIEGICIGGGSLLEVDDVERVAEAGGRFIASPISDARIIAAARSAGLVAMPGALTPTEIARAYHDGADIVKVFPMPSDGVAYLRSLRGPLPHIPLAPSGGIDDASAPLLLQAGATALNLGSWLTPAAASLSERLDRTRERAELLRAACGGKGKGSRE